MPVITSITDFNAPELDPYARLNEAQLMHYNEPNEGYFLAESAYVIERALDAGYEPVSILAENKHIEGELSKILKRPACIGIPVYAAEFEVLCKLTGYYMTRGALSLMKRKKLPETTEICRDASRIVILENVMNPTNIGAIFRSAAALGMDAILLTPGCSDPLYRRAIRVSMGTVFQIPWCYVQEDPGRKGREGQALGWSEASMEQIHEMGFHTVAMALRHDSVRIDDPALHAREKLAIVLGTEGDGLADRTIMKCDDTVRIPMAHGVDSLNVAAASAVAFWELGRKM